MKSNNSEVFEQVTNPTHTQTRKGWATKKCIKYFKIYADAQNEKGTNLSGEELEAYYIYMYILYTIYRRFFCPIQNFQISDHFMPLQSHSFSLSVDSKKIKFGYRSKLIRE